MLRGQLLSTAKSAYVTGMRQLHGRVEARRGADDRVPDRDRRLAHWAHSLPLIYNSPALAALDVPWWTYRAIDIVDAWLAARPRPVRAFEYGSGVSSLWLSRRIDEVNTVEHDLGFADLMRPLFDKAGVSLDVCPPVPSDAPVVPSQKEGYAGQDFAGYVSAIDKVSGKFDLIAIDGRAREACLQAAIPRLKDDGMIVFDNTSRRRYREAIARSGLVERRLRGLTPTLPYPDCTSLLTLPPSV